MTPTLIVVSLVGCGKDLPEDSDSLEPLAPRVEALTPFDTFVVTAGVPGVAEGWFLLDTGAERLGLVADVYAEVDPDRVDLDFAGRRHVGLDPRRVDLELASGLLGLPLIGLIGADVLGEGVVVLDRPGGAVYPLDACPPVGRLPDAVGPWLEHPLSVVDGLLVTTARFEGRSEAVGVLVDTGTSSAVLSAALVDALGARQDGRTLLRGSSMASSGGEVDAEVLRLSSVELGGAEARRAWASVAPDSWFRLISADVGEPIEAILGGALFRELAACVDYPGGRLSLAPWADTGHIPDEFDAVGIELILTEDGERVWSVFLGSDAERVGVGVGDRLLSVDGVEVQGRPHLEVVEALRGEPGTAVTLALEGEAGAYEVTALREALLPPL